MNTPEYAFVSDIITVGPMLVLVSTHGVNETVYHNRLTPYGIQNERLKERRLQAISSPEYTVSTMLVKKRVIPTTIEIITKKLETCKMNSSIA